VTAAEQSMNEWLELALLGAFGEAGPNQIGKGAARDSIYVLSGERHIGFKRVPVPEINGGRYRKAEQILAANRSLESIERAADGEITFRVILGETCTRTKKQYA